MIIIGRRWISCTNCQYVGRDAVVDVGAGWSALVILAWLLVIFTLGLFVIVAIPLTFVLFNKRLCPLCRWENPRVISKAAALDLTRPGRESKSEYGTKTSLVDAIAKDAAVERRWRRGQAVGRIGIVVTLLVPLIVVTSAWLLPGSPKLRYHVQEEIKDNVNHVTVTIGNNGHAPSMNLNGWIEFPAGEEPVAACGPEIVRVIQRPPGGGDSWQRLRGLDRMPLRRSQRRIEIRTDSIQPGIVYKLHFYAMRLRPTSDSGDSWWSGVDVYLIDDSGAADRVQWVPKGVLQVTH